MHVRAAALEVQEAASRAVRRSRLATAPILTRRRSSPQRCTDCVELCAQPMERRDESQRSRRLRRAYDEHARGAYRAAYRVLGNAAQAQDVVQDVFLKLWRQPEKFDARRGELGSYLRLMARSRALDLWREGQAAGRASDRLKLGVAREEGARRRAPRGRRRARGAAAHRARRPARAPARAARGRRARLLGRADRRRDRPALPTSRSARRRAASASGWRRLRREFEERAVARPGRRLAVASGGRCPSTEASSIRACCPSTCDGREALGEADWFDAHTHIGQNDPDGRKATPEEILGGLDAAGHQRALLFAMHEPDGYAAGQRRRAGRRRGVRAAASRPLARIAPNADDALAEAQRCLDAGARGFKLHPRSDAFGLPHPVVEEVVALAHERRAPGALPRRARDPAPRRGRRRPRAPLSRRAADPRPRGHQRPRLDRRRGRRAAEPLLRHRVVERRRPAAALRHDPARADPLRERHALRARAC